MSGKQRRLENTVYISGYVNSSPKKNHQYGSAWFWLRHVAPPRNKSTTKWKTYSFCCFVPWWLGEQCLDHLVYGDHIVVSGRLTTWQANNGADRTSIDVVGIEFVNKNLPDYGIIFDGSSKQQQFIQAAPIEDAEPDFLG